MMHSTRRYIKIYAYTLLGAGVTGVGLSLAFDLDKLVVLPLFPDILDAISVISAGALLLYEVFREAVK